ncbi:MAG: response regulator [Deltaproteobacteria bacterium]|jgi:CheY-like chemotaxis protein|nr:response regulator [Deltaproteobacteria bacterium]MBW2536223.1 response regulator [Deltaproteobacteria bacterium]
MAPSPKRIAILDDSSTIRQVISGLLEGAGHEVVPCATWPELEEVLGQRSLDLVLLDVEMPDIVGDHIGFAIKRGRPDLRVVYLSDHDEETLRAMSERTGVDGFIRKGSDPTQLRERILAELSPTEP